MISSHTILSTFPPRSNTHSSPSYQLAKSKNRLNGSKEAPLADPEPTSDISNQLASTLAATATTTTSTTNGNNHGKPAALDGAAIADATSATPQPSSVASSTAPHPPKQLLHSVASDSITNSPLTADAPCELLPGVAAKATLPDTLQALHGGIPAGGPARRTEGDRKCVLYVLAADDEGHTAERAILRTVADQLRVVYAARGFEVQLCDGSAATTAPAGDALAADTWTTSGPMEARGGHGTAAPMLAEIASK